MPRRGLDEWTRERVDFVTDDEIFNGGYFLAHFDAADLFTTLGGTRDPATSLFGAVEDPIALVKMFAPKAEGHILEGVGHWTQQERPDAVNRILIDWLNRI